MCARTNESVSRLKLSKFTPQLRTAWHGVVRKELEDRAFEYAYPTEYEAIKKLLKSAKRNAKNVCKKWRACWVKNWRKRV